VAAIAAYFLSDERMGVQEWLGAAMILYRQPVFRHMEDDQLKEARHV